MSRYLHYTADDLKILWDQSRELTGLAQDFRTFTPELHIVLLASHDIAQHQGTDPRDYRLHRSFDLYKLTSLNTINWSAVARYAAHFRCQDHTIQALYQVDQIFGLPVEFADAADQIAGSNGNRHYSLFAVNPSRYAAGFNKMKLAYKVLTPRQFLEFISEQILFPPAELMRAKYQIAADQPIWPYYVKRASRHVVKLGEIGLSHFTRKFRRSTGS